ncbi:MAG: hypothetical protein ABEH81_13310 [Halopenitus sp.]
MAPAHLVAAVGAMLADRAQERPPLGERGRKAVPELTGSGPGEVDRLVADADL